MEEVRWTADESRRRFYKMQLQYNEKKVPDGRQRERLEWLRAIRSQGGKLLVCICLQGDYF